MQALVAMGKVTGFLEYKRNDRDYSRSRSASPLDEFILPLKDDNTASRRHAA